MLRVTESSRPNIGRSQRKSAAETQLRILETSRHQLLSIAQSMKEETGDKSEEELCDMTIKVLYNRSRSQNMVRTLIGSQDQQLANKAHDIMLEAVEAAQRNTSELGNRKQGINGLRSGSEVSSITGEQQSGLGQCRGTLATQEIKRYRAMWEWRQAGCPR